MFAKSTFVASFALAVILLVSNGMALTTLDCGCHTIEYSCNKEQDLRNLDYVRVVGCKCNQPLGDAIQTLLKNNPATYLDGNMPNVCTGDGKQDLNVGTDDHTDQCKQRDDDFLKSLCVILKNTDCAPASPPPPQEDDQPFRLTGRPFRPHGHGRPPRPQEQAQPEGPADTPRVAY